MSQKFDSIFINGQSLRPAPYIGTSYEYNTSGEYVIGGFLIITLSGTIVGEDIAAQINELSALQTQTNCISVRVGCSGGSDFLEGAGRIRSVTISPSDQPYLASYSMQIALETVDGAPAVEADEEFLRQTCLTGQSIGFLQSYNETLNISGEGNIIASVDNVLKVSKSYIKASGKISLSSFMREVCGIPDYDGSKNSINILKERAKSLMSMSICVPDSPLSQFSGWYKWLDTKSLTIDANGSVTWSFDMYMSQGDAQPIAWIDINTEDQEKQDRTTPLKTRNISGTIKGLSSANISDYLADRVDVNERINNANTAYQALAATIAAGTWPTDGVVLLPRGEECEEEDDNPCNDVEEEDFCDQRISSTLKRSPVNGEITFSAQYGPISACKPKGVGKVDFTVEEQLPAARHVEYIIPGAGDSVVISLNAPTPHKVTISARGSLQGCDKTKLPELIACVEKAFNQQIARFQGTWLALNQAKQIGTYSYSLSKEFIKCEG